MAAPLWKVVHGCLCGVVFCLHSFPFPDSANGQEQLVRPEPAHLAALVLGGGALQGKSAIFGPLGAFIAGREDGMGLWRFTPPPGLKTPFLVGALMGMEAGHAMHPFPALCDAVSLLDLGHQYGLYQFVDPARVLPLADFLMDQVRDREPIGESDYGAYLQAVVQAGKVSFDAFWRAGNPGLTRGDLMNQSARLRGQVVRGQGIVRRIRRLEPLGDAVKLGVPELYEAWIFQDLYGANPICVVVPSLSAGLRPAENLQRPVQFAGYFLKAYRYQTAQTVQGKPVERECPLLVGPGLMGLPEPAKPSADMGNWPKTLLGTLLGVFAVAITLVWAMTWWTRRGDRLVRARLEGLNRANRSAEKELSTEKPTNETIGAFEYRWDGGEAVPGSKAEGNDSFRNPFKVE